MTALRSEYPCGAERPDPETRRAISAPYARHVLTCRTRPCAREGAAMLREWARWREAGALILLDTGTMRVALVSRHRGAIPCD
jgi:hypothetical protein